MTIEISLEELQMLERAARFVISDNIAEMAWQEDNRRWASLQKEAEKYDRLRMKLYNIIITSKQNGTTTCI